LSCVPFCEVSWFVKNAVLINPPPPPNLLGKIAAPLVIHIARRLIEERDIQPSEAAQQCQAHGERRAHLLSAAQLSEAALLSIAAQHDLIVILPGELR